MECSVCGAADELLYTCSRCGELLCATHQGRSYHRCDPGAGEWTPPGTRDTTEGGRTALLERADEDPTVDRPAAQLFPERRAAGADGLEGEGELATDAELEVDAEALADLPPDAARPGYGPDRLRPDPVEPAGSMREWFRRQTYVSLAAKVGFLATLWSMLVFGSLAVALSVAAG